MQSNGNNILLGFFSLLLVIVLALMGCGGGSAGTGTGPVVVVQGAVLDESGTPVEDVHVRVVETGNEDTTSSSGEFEIETVPDSGNVTLEVSSDTGVAYITIDIPEDGGTVSITLRIDPRLTQVDAESLEVGAAIVGRCDIYFENTRIIRQSNKVPGDLSCVAKASVTSDGRRLAGVPVVVQYRDCDELLPWTTVAAGSTLNTPNIGIAQLRFPFIDDETHCLYRIVAPFGVPGLPALERIIHTSTYQRRQ
jgi:hypothetical protein